MGYQWGCQQSWVVVCIVPLMSIVIDVIPRELGEVVVMQLEVVP